jgi:tripartite-type tricarboxylate transporter receptor subunit TctC
MRTPGTTRKSFLIVAAVAALASVAKADRVADFYKGRSVSMIIGYSVGGGYDAYARLLAHYFGRHIRASPRSCHSR